MLSLAQIIERRVLHSLDRERTSAGHCLIDPAPASGSQASGLPDGSNTRSTWRFSTDAKRQPAAPVASHTGDSVWRTRAPYAPTVGFGEKPRRSIGRKLKARSGGPNVSITQIRGLLGGELVFALQGGQPVLRKAWHRDVVGGLEIDPVQA